MPSDSYRILIRADKIPPSAHERLFNKPTINEVGQ